MLVKMLRGTTLQELELEVIGAMFQEGSLQVNVVVPPASQQLHVLTAPICEILRLTDVIERKAIAWRDGYQVDA